MSAPRLFQSYRSLAFEPINNRAHARTWLGATRWQHPPAELRDRMQTWAGLIRVEPLHTEFWGHLFDGPAAAFAELGWRSRVPPLFIPTPGLAALAPLPLSGVVGRLADMFDVPNGSVPSAGELTTALATMTSMAPHVAILLANVPDGTPAPRLAAIHQALDAIDAALGQTLVPAPPSPPGLTVATVRGWRQAILDHLDAGPLERLKSFMSAAAASLRTGDGLQFYLLFAGLPVFVFGRPQMPKNGIVYHRDHAAAALQSWYRCLWADPLPAAGPHTTATFSGNEARLAPLLVDTDRHSIASICPLPRYGDCMRRRPLPSNEADPDCESSTEP